MCKLHTKIFVTFVLIEVECSSKYWKFQKNNIFQSRICARCGRARGARNAHAYALNQPLLTKIFITCFLISQSSKCRFFCHSVTPCDNLVTNIANFAESKITIFLPQCKALWQPCDWLAGFANSAEVKITIFSPQAFALWQPCDLCYKFSELKMLLFSPQSRTLWPPCDWFCEFFRVKNDDFFATVTCPVTTIWLIWQILQSSK
jgi:hypothetical protein